MTDTTTIQPGEVYAIAIQTLPPEDIDHHYSDLYLKVTPASLKLIRRIEGIASLKSMRLPFHPYPALLGTFISQIDGCKWYELPFYYMPFWEREE